MDRHRDDGDADAARFGPLQAHLLGVPALRAGGQGPSVVAYDGVTAHEIGEVLDARPPAGRDAITVYGPGPAIAELAREDGTAATFVELGGSLGADGDECFVDELMIIESIALAEARYFPMAGPTYLCQSSPSDRATLLELASEFRSTGALPEYLLSPLTITEFGGWAGVCGCGEELPWRTTLRAGDPEPTGCPVGPRDDDAVQAGVPLLMGAALAARRLLADAGRIRFSGAGLWLNPPDDLGTTRAQPAAPMCLAQVDGQPVAVDLRTLRSFRVGSDAAWMLELLLWGDEDALRRAARRRGLHLAALDEAAADLASRLQVDVAPPRVTA